MLVAHLLETVYSDRGYTFRQLTHFGPEQWLVFDDGPVVDINDPRFGAEPECQLSLIGYLRFRYGYFTTNWATGTGEKDMVIGEEAYNATIGDNMPYFTNWNERAYYLSNTLMALAGIKKESLSDYPGERVVFAGL